MKTAKKFFKIIGIIIGILVIALLAYLIYLYASYHRIEDNLPLEVESHAEQADAKLTTGKSILRLHTTLVLEHILRTSASLWTAGSLPGQRVKTAFLRQFREPENWWHPMIRILH